MELPKVISQSFTSPGNTPRDVETEDAHDSSLSPKGPTDEDLHDVKTAVLAVQNEFKELLKIQHSLTQSRGHGSLIVNAANLLYRFLQAYTIILMFPWYFVQYLPCIPDDKKAYYQAKDIAVSAGDRIEGASKNLWVFGEVFPFLGAVINAFALFYFFVEWQDIDFNYSTLSFADDVDDRAMTYLGGMTVYFIVVIGGLIVSLTWATFVKRGNDLPKDETLLKLAEKHNRKALVALVTQKLRNDESSLADPEWGKEVLAKRVQNLKRFCTVPGRHTQKQRFVRDLDMVQDILDLVGQPTTPDNKFEMKKAWIKFNQAMSRTPTLSPHIENVLELTQDKIKWQKVKEGEKQSKDMFTDNQIKELWWKHLRTFTTNHVEAEGEKGKEALEDLLKDKAPAFYDRENMTAKELKAKLTLASVSVTERRKTKALDDEKPFKTMRKELLALTIQSHKDAIRLALDTYFTGQKVAQKEKEIARGFRRQKHDEFRDVSFDTHLLKLFRVDANECRDLEGSEVHVIYFLMSLIFAMPVAYAVVWFVQNRDQVRCREYYTATDLDVISFAGPSDRICRVINLQSDPQSFVTFFFASVATGYAIIMVIVRAVLISNPQKPDGIDEEEE